MVKDPNAPERPRAEPEIIPPDRTRGSAWPPPGFTGARGTHRIYVTQVRPFGVVLVMLAIAFVAAIVLLLMLGAVLLWLPFVAAFVIVAAITGLFRRR